MELVDLTHSAVTTRYFSAEPVPDEPLLRALDHARYAPNGGNRQPVHFVVVRDPDSSGTGTSNRRAYYQGALDGQIGVGATDAARALRSANHMAEHLHEVPVLRWVTGRYG